LTGFEEVTVARIPKDERDACAAISALLLVAARHYHATLLASGDALSKLRWRGEYARELVEYFQLGYSDGTLERALAPSSGTEDKITRDDLRSLGLLKWSGRELFLGAIVVPIRDAFGDVVQMCGAHHVSSGRNTPNLFLPELERGVFHPEAFALSEELIVAPSVLDALRFFYAGHPNVTASEPDLVLTRRHVEMMQEAGTRRVLFAFDSGRKGDEAALAAASLVNRTGVDAYRAPLARRWKPDSKRWGLMLRHAVPMLGAPERLELAPLEPSWRRLTKKNQGGEGR
jgi:hypothetical protein